MMAIISGRKLSKKIREDIKKDVSKLVSETAKIPHLVVVLVGDNPASQSYVKYKKRACKEVGIKSTVINEKESITEQELLTMINRLNDDESVHGILVQLPLPDHIDENKVIDTIKLQKDVDGFHPLNLGYMLLGRDGILPATPKGIITMLKSENINLEGKDALIIGRSNIVGKPLGTLLMKENATVTTAHSRTQNLKEKCLRSDVIVAAVGRPKLVTEDMVKPGAVVIDVGVNRVDNKLVGDVDYEAVKDKVSYITPVPGGVGPMTITSLLQNVVLCFKRIELT
ncbi:MAG: bifunctional methylenetetrahydrofolate dehydrogenase/methenyltetrahydrofolate cyclohydrolase FolD [Candidatus Izimaplasma sp.]|nr:bifunctional methylenetetrahydrofolate dehydrogenase/methenyltetrahydrofolate cyclohydrolase FolD [Candidatus Izimaplasma bacterium]